ISNVAVVAEASSLKISPAEISVDVEQESMVEDLHLLFPQRVYRPSSLALSVVAIDEVLVPCSAARPANLGRLPALGFDKSDPNSRPDAQLKLLSILQQKLIWMEMVKIQKQLELEEAIALEALAVETEAELFGEMELD
ncbi:hypothetical protein HDU81_007078, partial [Chytriomyces hyalinus]